MKLYFLTGLPTETDEDTLGIVELAERCVDLAKANGQNGSVTVSVGGFVPKAYRTHWYLPLLAVDCAHQGRGYGSALLRHGLERCDRDGLPAYLEASSPRNKPLYERHGFREIGVIQGGTSPPVWPMVRNP